MKLHIKNLCQIVISLRFIVLMPLFMQVFFWQAESFSLQENQDWMATFSAGFGRTRFMDGDETNILHSKIDFIFKPIDSEKPLEVKFVLMTQSPLREDDGFIRVPLDERDFAQISEAWIRYQIFKNLEFKFGSFPDIPCESTPLLWPYYSIGVKIDAIKSALITWNFIARQDFFGMYARELNSSTSTEVERTRVESNFNINSSFENNKFSLDLRTHYDQYSDPDSTLSSLSIGRGEYIDLTVTNRQQKYRIVDIGANITFDYNNFIKNTLHFKSWRNLSADSFGNGYLYGIEGNLYNRYAELELSYWYFLGEQSSIPPSGLSSYYYPGFQISSFHLAGKYLLSENWKGILEYRYQQSSSYGQDISPNLNPGSIPVIPLYKIYFIIEYAIGAS